MILLSVYTYYFDVLTFLKILFLHTLMNVIEITMFLKLNFLNCHSNLFKGFKIMTFKWNTLYKELCVVCDFFQFVCGVVGVQKSELLRAVVGNMDHVVYLPIL